MPITAWTQADAPDQSGRTVLITGTGGIGLQAATALAAARADVTIAGRNEARGAEAVDAVRAVVPRALIRFEPVDLANLTSIRALGARLRTERTSLDVLINNAGLMAPPARTETADGFELQLGTNHLGHFALTRELLPVLREGTNPRVVTVASIAANTGTINLADLQSRQVYRPMGAYSQSKLANIMFALELQRRSDLAGWGLASMAVHPGFARTELAANGAGSGSLLGRATQLALLTLGQPAAQGALPLLYAATAAPALGGHYYGPGGFRELRGTPTLARVPARANDATVAGQLWDASQNLTGGAPPSEWA